VHAQQLWHHGHWPQALDKFGLPLNSRRAFANVSCRAFQRSLHMHGSTCNLCP